MCLSTLMFTFAHLIVLFCFYLIWLYSFKMYPCGMPAYLAVAPQLWHPINGSNRYQLIVETSLRGGLTRKKRQNIKSTH